MEEDKKTRYALSCNKIFSNILEKINDEEKIFNCIKYFYEITGKEWTKNDQNKILAFDKKKELLKRLFKLCIIIDSDFTQKEEKLLCNMMIKNLTGSSN